MEQQVTGHVVTEIQEGADPVYVFVKGSENEAQGYIDNSIEMDALSGEERVYTISNEIVFDPNAKHKNSFVNVN